jgi:uncharacterized membrane protein
MRIESRRKGLVDMYQISDSLVPLRVQSTPFAWWDLALVWGAGLAVLGFDLLWPQGSGVARAAIGIPFGLLAPGYTAALCLFPRRRDLDGVERGALALILSVAATGGVVYGLSRLGIPATTASDVLSLLALTGTLSLVALVRRHALGPDERYLLHVHLHRTVGGGLVLVAVMALATALVVAPAWQATAPAAWIVGPSGFPSAPYATGATHGVIALYISNPERGRLAYHATAAVNGTSVWARTLTCPAHRTCRYRVPLPPTGYGTATWRLRLADPGQPALTRHLVLHYRVG